MNTDNQLTNVAKLSRLTDVGHLGDGFVQIVHYHIGVGTGTSSMNNTADAMFGRG